MRNKLADNLNDPSIRTIRLYDLRRYFCTEKLNDIGNPYTVMVLMGYTKLTTAQRYMHLLNFNDDEWTCTGATTAKEATKLIGQDSNTKQQSKEYNYSKNANNPSFFYHQNTES